MFLSIASLELGQEKFNSIALTLISSSMPTATLVSVNCQVFSLREFRIKTWNYIRIVDIIRNSYAFYNPGLVIPVSVQHPAVGQSFIYFHVKGLRGIKVAFSWMSSYGFGYNSCSGFFHGF